MTAATPGQAAYEAMASLLARIEARNSVIVEVNHWDELDDEFRAAWEAAALAAVAAQQPQPARGDVLYVTPGDGTAIGGLLAHVGVEPQPAPDLQVAGLRSELTELTDNHNDLLNEILLNTGDEYDGDEAADAIAVRYVRDLEAGTVREPVGGDAEQPAPELADADRLLDWAARLIVTATDEADVLSAPWRSEQQDWLGAFNATPPVQPAPAVWTVSECLERIGVLAGALHEIKGTYTPGTMAHDTAHTALDQSAALEAKPAPDLGTARLLDEAREQLAALAALAAELEAEAFRIAPPGAPEDPPDMADYIRAETLNVAASRIRAALPTRPSEGNIPTIPTEGTR